MSKKNGNVSWEQLSPANIYLCTVLCEAAMSAKQRRVKSRKKREIHLCNRRPVNRNNFHSKCTAPSSVDCQVRPVVLCLELFVGGRVPCSTALQGDQVRVIQLLSGQRVDLQAENKTFFILSTKVGYLKQNNLVLQWKLIKTLTLII